MGSVIDNLMIDQWNIIIDYKQYYNGCDPSQCSYTFTTRGGILYIFATIIGMFGGLIVVLRIIVKITVNFIRSKIRKRTENEENIRGK